MDVFLSLFKEMPLVVLGFIFMSLFFVFYIIQYIYISYNLKGICRIIFHDEKYFRLPLKPFNCFLLVCFQLFLEGNIKYKKEC